MHHHNDEGDNVFALCVCVFVCHDVCPDDLIIKDWCYTYNILQVYRWRLPVLQSMYHELLTSSMTSPGYKVGTIMILPYRCQYFSQSIDQRLKILEILMVILPAYSISGIISSKMFVSTSKVRPFWKYRNIKHSFEIDLKHEKPYQIMTEKVFLLWWRHGWRDRLA